MAVNETSNSTTAAAGTTLVSSGMDDNIIVTHVDGETDSIVIDGTADADTFVLRGDGEGGNININGITYEIAALGGPGDDTFIAESGNVIVNGGEGAETYVWQGGNLLIDQTGVEDTEVNLIIDNESVTLSDFLFFPVNVGAGIPGTNDLSTFVLTTGEQITFVDQFLNFDPNQPVDKVVHLTINDGPEIILDDFEEWVFTYNTADDVTGQTVFADGGDDIVTGTAEDDILSGGTGNDLMDGLIGSDYVDGGQGDDTFIYTYEGGGNADFYIGATGVDTVQVNLTQAEYDTFEIREDLVGLTDFVEQTADATQANGNRFDADDLGLTVTSVENIEVFVDGEQVDVTPIILDIAPSVSGEAEVYGTITTTITTTTVIETTTTTTTVEVPFVFDPPPQDFPDLTEGKRLTPESLINGTSRDHLTFDNSHDVEVNFISESAGYKNVLGYYTVSEDGTISDVSFLTENASGTGNGVRGGGDFNTGDLIADLGMLEAGTEIGFFIVANGYNMNNQFRKFDVDEGTLEFRNSATNDAAKITDSYQDTDLVFTDADGKEIAIKGNVYHASSETLNSDGIVHSVSGLNEEGNLTISFEDLYTRGDADFDDIVFELDIADAITTETTTTTTETTTTTTTTSMEDVAIAADFVIADEDDNTITEMTIEFSDGQQAGDFVYVDADVLAETNISMTTNPDGSLTLSGADTASSYESVLQTLMFSSDAETPMIGDREVTVEVTDADGLSDSASITVAIEDSGETIVIENVLSGEDPLDDMFDTTGGGTEIQPEMSPVEFDMGLNVDDMTPPPSEFA